MPFRFYSHYVKSHYHGNLNLRKYKTKQTIAPHSYILFILIDKPPKAQTCLLLKNNFFILGIQ